MKYSCPNDLCYSNKIIKDGRYKRMDDSRIVQCLKCKSCGKRFSPETFKLEYQQKKRRVKFKLMQLLSSNLSQRRCAKILGVNRKTVEKKVRYLGTKSRQQNERMRLQFLKNQITHMHFDDLITKENSKLKPLSVSIAVDENTRFILGAKVSQIPAFGHLSKIAIKKYGFRQCHHLKGLENLFSENRPFIAEDAVLKSDEHKKYPIVVKRYLPFTEHMRFKSERAHVAGQGELKKVSFDPLFAINHTCAMMRANINRLIRKTWCTTKDPKRLSDHLEIFIYFYNKYLIDAKLTPS